MVELLGGKQGQRRMDSDASNGWVERPMGTNNPMNVVRWIRCNENRRDCHN
jgi:hypothetical protein